jgi:hypothetical protein
MYFAKIYDKDYIPITQIFNFVELEIKQVISDISEASFSYYFAENDIKKEYFVKYNKIRIYKQIEKVETLIFD